jgi:leucyl-tRNA synthetase
MQAVRTAPRDYSVGRPAADSIGTALPRGSADDANGGGADGQCALIDPATEASLAAAYLAVAHDLRGVPPAAMGDAAWDYVMRGDGTAEAVCAATGLPTDVARRLRATFGRVYPPDLYVSGADGTNDVAMALLNAVAVWETGGDCAATALPRRVVCHGKLLVDGERMTRSPGSLMQLGDAIDAFGADGVRLALADAGDGTKEANVVRDVGSGFVLKLAALVDAAAALHAALPAMRTGAATLFDRIFADAVNGCVRGAAAAFDAMRYRDALRLVLFDLQAAQQAYARRCGGRALHRAAAAPYLEATALLLAPLAPHAAEHLWLRVLARPQPLAGAAFPVPTEDCVPELRLANVLVERVVRDVRAFVRKTVKIPQQAIHIVVFVATAYAPWQIGALGALRVARDSFDGVPLPRSAAASIVRGRPAWLGGTGAKVAVAFMVQAMDAADAPALSADVALRPAPPIDGLAIVAEAAAFIAAEAECASVIVVADDSHDATPARPRIGMRSC